MSARGDGLRPSLPRRWAVLAWLLASTACAAQAPAAAGASAPAAADTPAPAAADTPSPASAPASAAASAPASPPPRARWQLRVEAPDRLAELLQQHLDIARLPALAGDEPVPEAELRRLLDATPAQARELLQTEGYFDPRLALTREGELILVRVTPGPRTRVGSAVVDVVGDAASAAAAGDTQARALLQALREDWALPVGRAFRNEDWSGAKTALLTRLRGAGYAAAGWLGTGAEVDPGQSQVRIYVVADSGPLFRLGALQIEGLQHHDAQTVRDIAGFGAGTPLTEDRVLDFQDRLRQSGLFDRIDIGFDPDPAQAAAAPLRVRLAEAPRQVWTLGLGYSADVGPRASVEHLHRRLFGHPLAARNKLEWARLRQAWDGEIATHPGPKQWRWLLGGAVERLEGSDDVVLSQRLRLGRAQNGSRIDRLLYLEAERSAQRRLVPGAAVPEHTELALSANAHGVWRRLDDAILPSRGWTVSLQGGVGHAQGDRSDSGWFSRLYGRLTLYRPLPAGVFGQARIELGQVLRRERVAVPDSQQFRAGGDDSVRGYAYRSLGPLVDGAVGGGDALATFSLELARPLSARLPALWGAVFVDAGNAAADFGHLRPAVGSGVGLRYRSPVGPLKLDLAYGHELQSWRLHFGVGIAF